jgi:hypothetical protein
VLGLLSILCCTLSIVWGIFDMHSISGIGYTSIFECFGLMSFLLPLCVENQLVYLQILTTAGCKSISSCTWNRDVEEDIWDRLVTYCRVLLGNATDNLWALDLESLPGRTTVSCFTILQHINFTVDSSVRHLLRSPLNWFLLLTDASLSTDLTLHCL